MNFENLLSNPVSGPYVSGLPSTWLNPSARLWHPATHTPVFTPEEIGLKGVSPSTLVHEFEVDSVEKNRISTFSDDNSQQDVMINNLENESWITAKKTRSLKEIILIKNMVLTSNANSTTSTNRFQLLSGEEDHDE